MVHSNSGCSPWTLWDSLFWYWCCSGPGSEGQERSEPAAGPPAFTSRVSLSEISFWMPALTSEVTPQASSWLSALQRDTEIKTKIDTGADTDRYKKIVERHFLIRLSQQHVYQGYFLMFWIVNTNSNSDSVKIIKSTTGIESAKQPVESSSCFAMFVVTSRYHHVNKPNIAVMNDFF